MDVIGFLCVSLGSSTVQLHDSLGFRHACACSEAGFSSQYDRPWGVYYWEQCFIVRYLWAKWLNAEGITKEVFPLYVGKGSSLKVVHDCAAIVSLMKRLKRKSGNGWDNSQKDFYAVWFDVRAMLWDECVEDMSRNKMFFFLRFRMSHVLRFITICDLFPYSPYYTFCGLGVNLVFYFLDKISPKELFK
jgi:hypothetical protein